jgi:hypothetical protein
MTKLIFKASLLLTCLFVCYHSKAQQDSTVTIIFAGDKNKSSKAKKKLISQNSIFKVAPTGVFVGQIPLIYERKLTPNISIQVGAGLTNQNYIRGLFVKAQENNIALTYPTTWDENQSSDQADELYDFTKNRKVELGTMFSIQPKFYYDDDAMDGGYIGFSYNIYNYKFSSNGATYTPSGGLKFNDLTQRQSETETITDFMLHYGKQVLNGHFAIEYSSAIGLRKVEGTKYVAQPNSTAPKGYVDGPGTYKQTLFNYEMAIRVGYVF